MSSDCIAWSARFAIPEACTQHEKTIRKPCAGNPHARFERRIQEPGPAWAPRLSSTNVETPRVGDAPADPGCSGRRLLPPDAHGKLAQEPDLRRAGPHWGRAV